MVYEDVHIICYFYTLLKVDIISDILPMDDLEVKEVIQFAVEHMLPRFSMVFPTAGSMSFTLYN